MKQEDEGFVGRVPFDNITFFSKKNLHMRLSFQQISARYGRKGLQSGWNVTEGR
jgi:hypothetical protein